MAKFEALERALELVAAVKPLVAMIRLSDRNLADQLRDAVTAVPGNIAEGAGRNGRDRQYHYKIAGGSAREVHTHVRTALVMEYVGQDDAAPALALGDRVAAMLWRLAPLR